MKRIDDEKKEAFYNRSLERALQILNAFSSERRALTLGQLAEILDLSKATVLRLCSTLVKYGFLKQDGESKQYWLGIKLFELGSIVSASFSIQRAAASHLAELQRKLGQTVFLGVLADDELLYIDKREDPKNAISFTSHIGKRRPPYWGMLGPVLMAHLPPAEIERLLEREPLAASTRKSITGKEKFMEWLEKIRRQGYAFDDSLALEGIGGVGAPVRDFNGAVVAALGVSFIASSIDGAELKRIVKEVTSTALAISKEIGYNQKRNF
jgi:DNA-binding IclR family transcriptional regulator